MKRPTPVLPGAAAEGGSTAARRRRFTGWFVPLVLVTIGCGGQAADSPASQDLTFDPGTEQDRAALFDYLLEKTMERDAYASLADHPLYRAHPLGIDVESEMRRYRDELVAADTDEKIWFALQKISNIRRDRHIRVHATEGGLTLPERPNLGKQAPIRFAVDYGRLEAPFMFVADLAEGFQDALSQVAIGDGLVAVNGRSFTEYADAMDPYQNYSTRNNFWWHLANEVTRVVDYIPPEYYGERLTLGLRSRAGRDYVVELPYLDPSEIKWQGHGEREYPGFTRAPGIGTYDTYTLYLPTDPNLRIVLLQWHGFAPDLVEAVDRLMEYAEQHGLLDRHLIVDNTRGGGGTGGGRWEQSRGAYAIQRLQPRPYRTTFGNLKVSDEMTRRTEELIQQIRAKRAPISREERWLLEWLEEDVRQAIEEGRRYTNDVPHKLYAGSKWSDGIVEPAPVHFRGGLTLWLSPFGGSHADQFAAIVRDNELGYTMGMPEGGYSNTWDLVTVLRFPTSGRPIVGYMWSLGHTIRPNGEMLQYNPAEPHEYIPQTRDNYLEYHKNLLERTLRRIGGGIT
ncbi:MAG: hypothetical protein HY704_12960 [Gemmatimonadetes bacterium]|nr:hypothetical protein [Gemmatimonadota bacterium]